MSHMLPYGSYSVRYLADQFRAFLESCIDPYASAGSIVLSHLATLGCPRGEDANLDTYLAKARRRKLSADEAFRSLLGSARPPGGGRPPRRIV
jgi:hypothetical protein